MVLKALKVLEVASQDRVIFIIILILQVIIVVYIFEFSHLKILVVDLKKCKHIMIFHYFYLFNVNFFLFVTCLHFNSYK
jgi:hypothetical protein